MLTPLGLTAGRELAPKGVVSVGRPTYAHLVGSQRTDPLKHILVAEDYEITDADFDLREILSVAPELKDIPPGHERFRVAIERIRGNSHRPRLDLHGGAAPSHVAKKERDHGSQQSIPVRPVGCDESRSALVRRLVNARDNPAQHRIRHWLSDISDDRLLSFGLTAQDIVLLRGTLSAPG